MDHLLKQNFLTEEPTPTPPVEPSSPGFLSAVEKAIDLVNESVTKTGSNYINLEFILGSAAEVKRIWSMAKYILVQERRHMSPKLFECFFIIMKYNQRFWVQIYLWKPIDLPRKRNGVPEFKSYLMI